MLYELWMIKNSMESARSMAAFSKEEVADFNQKMSELQDEAGEKVLVLANCQWANELYSLWGISWYPSLEARIGHIRRVQEAGLYQYYEAFSLLGSSDQEIALPPFPNPIYLLWYTKNDPAAIAAWNALSKEEQDRMWKGHEKLTNEHGVCMMLICNSYWSNDEIGYFGVEAYPNLESVQAFKAGLEKMNWPLYFPAFSILGTAGE